MPRHHSGPHIGVAASTAEDQQRPIDAGAQRADARQRVGRHADERTFVQIPLRRLEGQIVIPADSLRERGETSSISGEPSCMRVRTVRGLSSPNTMRQASRYSGVGLVIMFVLLWLRLVAIVRRLFGPTAGIDQRTIPKPASDILCDHRRVRDDC